MRLFRRARSSVLRHRPWLERLEDRCTPATISLIGSTLTISNPRLIMPNTALNISQQSDGRFLIVDGGLSAGRWSATNIVVNGSNFNDKITFTLYANKNLNGNLTINGFNGNDTVSLNTDSGSGPSGTESIGGNVSIDLGNGDDVATIGTTSGLTIRGNTTLIGGYGNDATTIGIAAAAPATTIRGNLGVYSMQSLTLGQGQADQVLGGLTMDLKFSPTAFSSEFNTLSLSTNAGTTIGNTLRVVGGALADTVTLNSAAIGPASGNVTHQVLLGEGNNSLAVNSTIKGNLTYTVGAGDDAISIAGASMITGAAGFGNLTLNMGDGTNTYNLNTGFQVFGDITINGGFPAQIIVLQANILGGDLTVNLGNGNNSLTVNVMNNPLNIHFTFGTGNDTLTLNGAGQTINGTINWGGPNPAAETFNHGTVVLGALTQTPYSVP